MDTFIAICLAIIVLELGVMIAVFIYTMLRLKDAAQAIEVAAYRVDQEVLSIGQTMRSGWGDTLRTLLSAGLAIFRREL